MDAFFTKSICTAAVVCTAGLLSAETISFNDAAAWQQSKEITVSDGVTNVKGRCVLTDKDFITVNPDSTYVLKLKAKSGNANKPWLLAGFFCYTANGRQIYAVNIQCASRTDTEFAADAKKGDTKVVVKNAEAWKTIPDRKMALNVLPGNKDLPNFNILPNVMVEKARVGENWEVTLKTPLGKDIAAGTKVRQHIDGGYLYFCTGFLGGNWQDFAGKFKYNNLWPGTDKVRLVILANWQDKPDDVTELKDIFLDIQ